MKKEVEQKIHEFAEHIYTLGYYYGRGEGLEELLNSTHINDLQYSYDEGYERGLNDAWKYARKISREEPFGLTTEELERIFNTRSIATVIERNTASEAIAKIKEYEEKQKQTEEWDSETMYGQFYENDEGIKAQTQTDDEIKVGDGVVSVFGKHGYVTGIDKDELYVLYPNGEVGHSSTNTYVKDGRYFSRMAEILKQMEGEND